MEGVTDRDGAARLTGISLYVPRQALPPLEEDEFYLADLVGMQALQEDGVPVGSVVAVDDFGAGVFLTLRDGGGQDRELPFTRVCVPEVNLAHRTLTVSLPDEVLVTATVNAKEHQDYKA